MAGKAQITAFVIMGVLIIVLVALGLYVVGLSRESVPNQLLASRPSLDSYVQECVEAVSADSVYILGLQGGYISKPEKIFQNGDLATSILFSDNISYVPSIESMEANLSAFVSVVLPLCVNFSLFPGYEITQGLVSADVRIVDDQIFFDVDWPIVYRRSGSESSLSQWSTVVPIDLMRFHNITSDIVLNTQANPSFIDHIFLLSQAMNISYAIYDGVVVYDLRDVEIFKDEMDYVFIFAVDVG